MENLDKRDTDFKKDLVKYGKTGEKDIAKFFESRGYTILDENEDNKYDFLATKGKKTITVEVKADYKCISSTLPFIKSYDTGNIYIEYTSWNRPAGIETTEADVYAYMFGALKPRELWLITVEKLKKLIADNPDLPIATDSGDEGSNTEGYLIPRYEHLDSFSLYKEIDGKWELQNNPN